MLVSTNLLVKPVDKPIFIYDLVEIPIDKHPCGLETKLVLTYIASLMYIDSNNPTDESATKLIA